MIYVVSMSDVVKALDETRSSRMKNVICGGSSPAGVVGGSMLEADIYLAADELIEDK